MARKIAIVGTSSTGESAPFHDPSWEFWGTSIRSPWFTRADRWFEVHRLSGYSKDWLENWIETHKKWRDGEPVPLYMIWPDERMGKDVHPIPVDHLSQRFGTFFQRTAITWMLAMAIDELCPPGQMAEKGSAIGVWGVDMEFGTEYKEQRVGVRHFMALASALGIETHKLVHGGLAFEPTPYPFWQDDPLTAKLRFRVTNTTTQLEVIKKSLTEINNKYHEVKGQLKEASLSEDSERCDFLADQLDQIEKEGHRIRFNVERAEGVLSEQAWIQDYLKP